MQYRETRRGVWENGTRRKQTTASDQALNQELLRQKISEVCAAASLARYSGNDNAAASLLWFHLWSKPQYAGIKAQIASNSIATLGNQPGSFNNWQMFDSPEWNIPDSVKSAQDVAASAVGAKARQYLMKDGDYADRPVLAKVSKLKLTVFVARAFSRYLATQASHHAVSNFVSAGETDPWRVFENLKTVGINGPLTRLHIMMDLGYPVVKPDIVLTSLFLKLGWLHHADASLPLLSKIDLHGKGKHGEEFSYDRPRMFKLVIDTARAVVGGTSLDDLKTDIGWATDNPLRELDLFMVKAGQKPETQYGIVTTVEALGS